MTDADAARFAECADFYAERVHQIAAGQWSSPTPCTEWDVRALVNHVTGEFLWAPHLLSGATIAEVGDRFDGDVLGEDPVASFDEAHATAKAAFLEPGALDGVVHLSYGDDSTRSYTSQMTLDALVHGWDLARGIGADDRMPEVLAVWGVETVTPMQELLTASGLFGQPIPVGTEASSQDHLLAMLGRRP